MTWLGWLWGTRYLPVELMTREEHSTSDHCLSFRRDGEILAPTHGGVPSKEHISLSVFDDKSSVVSDRAASPALWRCSK